MWSTLLSLALAFAIASSEGAEHNVERRATYTPVVNSIALYNTVKQQKIGHISNGQKIDICSLRSVGIRSPSQLAFRAWTANTESVDFTFNNKFYRRESYAPFTLCGDSGEGAYEGCADLKYGHQCISAKPYSKTDGKGTAGKTLTVCFDVVGCPAPVKPPVRAPVPVPVPVMPPPSVTSFELINTVKQNTIRTLTNGETIDVCKLSSVGIHEPSQLTFRAVTAGHVESVQFTKNSVFFRNDNAAFYSLCGDNAGFPYYGCADLAFGYQCISAKPCTQDNAAGVCGVAKQICFTIVGCPAPTKAPINKPTKAPVSAPTKAPINKPTKAPINMPTKAPVSAPTKAPINKPTKAPVSAPTIAPISKPTMAPINKQTTAPISAPTKAPINKPTMAPINMPTMAPINKPTMAPINKPTKAPVSAPTTAPIRPPVRAPVAAPVMSPIMPTVTCSSSPLGAATTYSLFISGNLAEFRENQGSVAVGGNGSFESTGVSIKGNLIINGNLSGRSGQVGGKLVIGGTNNAGPSFTAVGGITTGKPIDFALEKARLQLLSQTYDGYAATCVTTYNNREIVMTCDKTGLNVFTVDAAKLAAATSAKITVPHGATVLINVTGSSNLSLQQYFTTTIVGTSSNKVLWNMPSIPSLYLRRTDILGSILAPNAAINFKYGTFAGTIAGHSWIGDAVGIDSPFAGCLPIVH